MIASTVPNSWFPVFTLSMSEIIYKGRKLLRIIKK